MNQETIQEQPNTNLTQNLTLTTSSTSMSEFEIKWGPRDSVPFDELIVGAKYAFIRENNQCEAILIRKEHINDIALYYTKKPIRVEISYHAYTRTYLNNVRRVGNSKYRLNRYLREMASEIGGPDNEDDYERDYDDN